MRRRPDPLDAAGALVLGALAVVFIAYAFAYGGAVCVALYGFGGVCLAGAIGAWLSAWDDDGEDPPSPPGPLTPT